MTKYPPFEAKYEGKVGENFTVTIQVSDVERWNKYLDLSPKLAAGFKKVFENVVVEGNKYLIRLTPFDTGRLRGGWTSYLDKKNVDYVAAFMDTSLIEVKQLRNDADAINEGKGFSSFTESENQVTLVNSVPYIEYVEHGTSRMPARNFTRRAMYKIEHIFQKAVDGWMKECTEAGDFIDPKPTDEGMTP